MKSSGLFLAGWVVLVAFTATDVHAQYAAGADGYNVDATVAKWSGKGLIDQFNCTEGFTVFDEHQWQVSSVDDQAMIAQVMATYCEKPGRPRRMEIKSSRDWHVMGHVTGDKFFVDAPVVKVEPSEKP